MYRERLQEGKDDSLEGQILSVADKIDLLYETFGEIQNVILSHYFFEIYEMSLETIIQFDHLESVKILLKMLYLKCSQKTLFLELNYVKQQCQF